ncbi:unnamed protein product [Symbiodinium sp. CCMP2592]|nr:unnamed protein product [Symbiodinium sp. CCMP2592]CAE7226316.1 unnamed protein product [Symbiodinium sp. CCMP2592]CAE7349473.1 unnamed protein product [Symbiodinium sp. CCMP2592]CAE7698358.1 unnamed protein product [Symbiodinium sp. CCMP2592]
MGKPKGGRAAHLLSPIKVCRGKTKEKAAADSVNGARAAKALKLAKKKALRDAVKERKRNKQSKEDAEPDAVETPSSKVRRTTSPDSAQRKSVADCMDVKQKAVAAGKTVAAYLSQHPRKSLKKDLEAEAEENYTEIL